MVTLVQLPLGPTKDPTQTEEAKDMMHDKRQKNVEDKKLGKLKRINKTLEGID